MKFFETEYPPHDPERFEKVYNIPGLAVDTVVTNGICASLAAASHPDLAAEEEELDFYCEIANLLHLAHSKNLDVKKIVREAMENFHNEAAALPASTHETDA